MGFSGPGFTGRSSLAAASTLASVWLQSGLSEEARPPLATWLRVLHLLASSRCPHRQSWTPRPRFPLISGLDGPLVPSYSSREFPDDSVLEPSGARSMRRPHPALLGTCKF